MGKLKTKEDKQKAFFEQNENYNELMDNVEDNGFKSLMKILLSLLAFTLFMIVLNVLITNNEHIIHFFKNLF